MTIELKITLLTFFSFLSLYLKIKIKFLFNFPFSVPKRKIKIAKNTWLDLFLIEGVYAFVPG